MHRNVSRVREAVAQMRYLSYPSLVRSTSGDAGGRDGQSGRRVICPHKIIKYLLTICYVCWRCYDLSNDYCAGWVSPGCSGTRSASAELPNQRFISPAALLPSSFSDSFHPYRTIDWLSYSIEFELSICAPPVCDEEAQLGRMGVPELMALGFDDLLACKMTAQDVGPLMLAMKEILEGAQALDQKQVGVLWRCLGVERSCACVRQAASL